MKCKKSFCVLDPLPANMFYECLDIFIPYLTTIFNDSLLSGFFPTDFKDSLVTTRINPIRTRL